MSVIGIKSDVRLVLGIDGMGNRYTNAFYKDAEGYDCGTRLNGHLMLHSVMASLQWHRRGVQC